MSSKEMTERVDNVAFWKQMRAAGRRSVYDYAKKHGLTHQKAFEELQYWEILDEELKKFLAIESEYYIPRVEEE